MNILKFFGGKKSKSEEQKETEKEEITTIGPDTVSPVHDFQFKCKSPKK